MVKREEKNDANILWRGEYASRSYGLTRPCRLRESGFPTGTGWGRQVLDRWWCFKNRAMQWEVRSWSHQLLPQGPASEAASPGTTKSGTPRGLLSCCVSDSPPPSSPPRRCRPHLTGSRICPSLAMEGVHLGTSSVKRSLRLQSCHEPGSDISAWGGVFSSEGVFSVLAW
jgi:hypothetical protein